MMSRKEMSCVLMATMVAAVLALVVPAHAETETLAYFPFSGSSYADAAEATGVIVSDISKVGPGTIGFNSTSVNTESDAPAATLNNNAGPLGSSYYTFTISLEPGYSVAEWTSLSFYASNAGSNGGPFQASVIIAGQEFFLLSGTVQATPSPKYVFYTNSEPMPLWGGTAEFRLYAYDFGSTATTFRVDDVKVTGRVISGVAYNPSPADGAINQELDVELSWNTGTDPGIQLQYLYFSDDPNLSDLEPVETVAVNPAEPLASYGPLSLELDKTYYWRVDYGVEINGETTAPGDPNTIRGPLWYFSTKKSIPVILNHPEDVRVFSDQTAQLTTEFFSIYPVSVTWKKYIDGSNDQILVPDERIFIETTNTGTTLTISPAVLGDQGRYYCLLNNGSGEIVQSQSASLVINRIVAHYDFEETYHDLVGTNHGMGVSLDPNTSSPGFVSGIVGNWAVSFDGVSQYIDLGPEAYPKAGIGNGLEQGTISCWIKPGVSDVAGRLMSNTNNYDYSTSFSFSLIQHSSVQFYNRAVGTVLSPPLQIADNWHHVVATWETDNHLSVYVDGMKVATSSASTIPFDDWDHGVLIAGVRLNANDRSIVTPTYLGAMDDLRVYNYVLDELDVASLYHQVTGEPVCVTEGYASEFDFDGNCVVDLGDLAILSSVWLDCGWYPDCVNKE